MQGRDAAAGIAGRRVADARGGVGASGRPEGEFSAFELSEEFVPFLR